VNWGMQLHGFSESEKKLE